MSAAVTVDVRDDRVAVVEMRRPPHNFFSPELVEAIADALEGFDGDPAVRAAVLAADGRSFCAGANLGAGAPAASSSSRIRCPDELRSPVPTHRASRAA